MVIPTLTKREQLNCRTMEDLKNIAKDMRIRPRKLNKAELAYRISIGKPDEKITRKRKKKETMTIYPRKK